MKVYMKVHMNLVSKDDNFSLSLESIFAQILRCTKKKENVQIFEHIHLKVVVILFFYLNT